MMKGVVFWPFCLVVVFLVSSGVFLALSQLMVFGMTTTSPRFVTAVANETSGNCFSSPSIEQVVVLRVWGNINTQVCCSLKSDHLLVSPKACAVIQGND